MTQLEIKALPGAFEQFRFYFREELLHAQYQRGFEQRHLPRPPQISALVHGNLQRPGLDPLPVHRLHRRTGRRPSAHRPVRRRTPM